MKKHDLNNEIVEKIKLNCEKIIETIGLKKEHMSIKFNCLCSNLAHFEEKYLH